MLFLFETDRIRQTTTCGREGLAKIWFIRPGRLKLISRNLRLPLKNYPKIDESSNLIKSTAFLMYNFIIFFDQKIEIEIKICQAFGEWGGGEVFGGRGLGVGG